MNSKEFIESQIDRLDLSDARPYCWWHPKLFGSLNVAVAEEALNEKRFVIAVGSTLLWRDVQRLPAHSLSLDPDVLTPIVRLAMFYACLVFPRELDMGRLLERIPRNSEEYRLLSWYLHKTGDYRHVRNAIAHGNVEFSDDDTFVTMKDRDWKQHFPVSQLELDCLILSEVFQVLFEKGGISP